MTKMLQTCNTMTMLAKVNGQPQKRQNPGGSTCLKIPLATEETTIFYKGSDNEKSSTQKMWIDAVIWGKAIESHSDLAAGDYVYVRGKLQSRSWEDKDTGKKRYGFDLNVIDLSVVQKAASMDGQRMPPVQDDDEMPF